MDRQALERAHDIASRLYPHQVEGVGFLLGRRRAILADDMGLGKTRQSIVAMTEATPGGPYLVVCPASVKHNWAREIGFAFAGFDPPDVHVIGPGPVPNGGFDGWAIINYDLLKRHIDALVDLPFEGLVFDEAHYLKNHRTQRSRLSRRLVEDSTRGDPVIHVLTGTPLTNRPKDLFPLLQLVRHSLGRSFLSFAKRYCDGHKNDYGYWVTSGVSNVEELSVQLQGIMLRRRKEDVLDLPPKQRSWIDVEVEESIREDLDRVVTWFLGTDNHFGGGPMSISRARRRLAVAKVPHTLEYVKGAVEQGEKVVLFSCFTHATRRFAKALGEQAVVVTGEVPTSKRQAIIDRFQDDESIRVFIGQIQAAGIGINLTRARQVVFNDLDWVPANHWQAEDRTHRIGQTGCVNVTYMVARGSLEEFIRTVLETKSRLIDDVVEGKALGEDMNADVLGELRRMVAHLDTELHGKSAEDFTVESVESLLRAASDRYMMLHADRLSPKARTDLKPVSDGAIKALALALTGPKQTVYTVASTSGKDHTYRVEVEGSDITCDCKGFSYRGMCRHVRDLKQALATGAPVPPEFELEG